MPTQTNSSTAKTTTPKPQVKAAPPSPAERARSVAESAVDLPVGVVLEAADRVARRGRALHRPHRRRAAAQVLPRPAPPLRETGRAPRHDRPPHATREAKKTRTRVEREARKRRQRVRKAIDGQTTRAQDLVDQVSEQLSALR